MVNLPTTGPLEVDASSMRYLGQVNSGHPGWVKTELGGPKAPMNVEDSYKTSLRLATLDQDGPSGGLFHENDVLPW